MEMTIEGLDALDDLEVALYELETLLHDYERPLQNIKEYMKQRWITNYGMEGGIYTLWPALSSTWTIPERLAKGYGGGPKLMREGDMFAHFETQNEMGRVDFDAIEWEFTNATGAYTVRHDEGYANPIAGHAPIPARPLWDINADDQRRMELEISLYINEILSETLGV